MATACIIKGAVIIYHPRRDSHKLSSSSEERARALRRPPLVPKGWTSSGDLLRPSRGWMDSGFWRSHFVHPSWCRFRSRGSLRVLMYHLRLFRGLEGSSFEWCSWSCDTFAKEASARSPSDTLPIGRGWFPIWSLCRPRAQCEHRRRGRLSAIL